MTPGSESCDRLGIEFLSVLGLPPLEFVALAAELECGQVSVVVSAMTYATNLGYPVYALRDDAALRRRLGAALREHGVSVALGEGIVIRRGPEFGERVLRDLDVMAELAVPRINVISVDSDLARTLDQYGAVTSLAAERGIDTVLEFAPGMVIDGLDAALAVVAHVGSPHLTLLIDTMHLVRSHSGPDDVAAVDPALIGYVQLSDATLDPRGPDYLTEAMYERMVPGNGELPLLDILRALPGDVPIGLEIPQRALAAAGVGPAERLRPCVDAARQLLRRAAV